MVEKTKKLEQDLQQREKAELVTIIKLMLEQQPDLAWILQTSLPGTGKRVQSVDPDLYRSRIEKAVAAAEEHYRDRTYQKTLENMLAALQSTADAFAAQGDYLSALTLYEVQVAAGVEHYFTLDLGYLIFTPGLVQCIEGLDSCVAEAGEHQEMRQRAFKALFAIYQFSTESSLDLGEDVPDLLIENTTADERRMIAGWIRDVQTGLATEAKPNPDLVRSYRKLLRRLEK
jgi:hypothetical protein